MPSTDRARLLFINDHLGYEGGAWHGVTRYCVDVLPGIDPTRFLVTACFLRGKHPASEVLEARGISPLFLNRPRRDPGALRDIVRLVRERKIDLLHLGGHKAWLLGRIAARMASRPAIIHVHDVNPVGPALRFLQRRVAPWTSLAVAVSGAAADLAADQLAVPSDRIVVLQNAVQSDSFSVASPATAARLRDELALPSRARVVGLIGRLAPEKGQSLLIRAWSSLLARVPEALLLLVGEGPARRECEALVQRLGLEASVRLLGYRRDVADLLDLMEVVTVPSEREGFGYAALEAMAGGKPVVAFRVGGIPSIVADGETGLLVPEGDADGLVQALSKLLTDPDLRSRMSDRSRLRARQFNLEEHVRRLEAIYESVLRP